MKLHYKLKPLRSLRIKRNNNIYVQLKILNFTEMSLEERSPDRMTENCRTLHQTKILLISLIFVYVNLTEITAFINVHCGCFYFQ